MYFFSIILVRSGPSPNLYIKGYKSETRNCFGQVMVTFKRIFVLKIFSKKNPTILFKSNSRTFLFLHFLPKPLLKSAFSVISAIFAITTISVGLKWFNFIYVIFKKKKFIKINQTQIYKTIKFSWFWNNFTIKILKESHRLSTWKNLLNLLFKIWLTNQYTSLLLNSIYDYGEFLRTYS